MAGGGCHAPDVQTVCCALGVHCPDFIPGGAKLANGLGKLAIGHFNRLKRSLGAEVEAEFHLGWSVFHVLPSR